MLQEIRFQDQVLNPCKSIQETSEEVMDFKSQQLVSIKVYKAPEAQCSIASSTDKLSIEVYEK